MERRKDGPIIYTYAAIGGENRLLANLGDLPSFKAVPRYLPGTADLEAFLRGLGGREERVVAVGRARRTFIPARSTASRRPTIWRGCGRSTASTRSCTPRRARRRPRPIRRRRSRSRPATTW